MQHVKDLHSCPLPPCSHSHLQHRPRTRRRGYGSLVLAGLLPLALLAAPVPVALARSDADAQLEEVVITGTRRQARSVYDSSAPIDVIGGDDFRNQGSADMGDLIRHVVPSYNVNAQPISDAATVIRPANLRGLAPDQTLVLVNGKRRHRAAVISWLGNGVSDGAQGPDISVIPAIALKQLEILRDGASAQYGSDAIAGVMNFILKDDSEGGAVEAKYGQFSEDSEAGYVLAGNIGLPFTARGFFNASFEYSESDATDRSVQRPDAANLIAAGNTAVNNPAQIWGSPQVNADIKTFFNLGLELNDSAEAYAFGNYAYREVDGGFFFRNPDTRTGVFRSAEEDNRLVGDVTDDSSGNCAQYNTNSAGLNIDDAEGLAAVMADPDCFVFNERFPGGFTPRFGADVKDAALLAGVRGTLASGLAYDLSIGFGHSDADFFIYNTVNASLGPDSPTEFDPGDYTQTEYNVNADFSYPVAVAAFASDLNIAGGFEYRVEEFEITAGQIESWEVGPLAGQGFSPASNGFPGFSQRIAGNWDRANSAVWLDLEADISERWLLGMAVRYEDFDDFGSTFNGKLATHIDLTDWLGLRATWSSGFRAPTPGQQNASNVTTEFIGDMLINNGTIPPDSAVARAFGGQPLDAEESINYTLGLVMRWQKLSITLDYYNIEVSDRIALSQDYDLSPDQRQYLLDEGITAASSITKFRFFVNDYDTTTSGFDLVANYSFAWGAGVSDLSLAWNRTETTVDSFTPETVTEDGVIPAIIDAVRIREIEQGLPESRFNVTASHLLDNWRFLLRYNWTDGWYDSEDIAGYNGYWTADAEVAYSFDNGLSLMLGGQNFTDETPDESTGEGPGLGRAYSQYAPLGFNGGFYYGRLTWGF